MSKIDIARALKDKAYFSSLSAAEQAQVRSASPVGDAQLTNDELDSVAGGLEGGDVMQATTTTTDASCSCSSTGGRDEITPSPIGGNAGSCSCSC